MRFWTNPISKGDSIVSSSKTEHHAKRQVRIVPLFPEIEKELLKLHVEAEDKAEYVFPNLRGDSNLRTTLEKVIRRAGVKPWPKLRQNLRSSGATDFARSVPSHIAASICGHTEEIAKEHYRTVGDRDLDNVIDKLAPALSEKLAQKLAHDVVYSGPDSSLDGSVTLSGDTKKAQDFPGFVALYQLLSSAGFTLRMGEEGLDSSYISQGFSEIPPSVAHNIALFDVSTLWKSLDADVQVETLLFLESRLKDRIR
ncbi:MAG: hypothetical protein WCI02_15760 [Planctomycetota bacterium]